MRIVNLFITTKYLLKTKDMRKIISKKSIIIIIITVIFITIILSIINYSLIKQHVVDVISGATKEMKLDGNSLFHQSKEVSLATGSIEVLGEVESPGKINFDDFYKREVMIKESRKDKNGINFVGAYRYVGYSLFDILHPYNQKKKNKELFKPITDLYVIIKNDKNEKVVFSWSEIFHTNNQHQILIATEMAPIKPHRKEVDFPIGKTWKIVASNDLYSNRILENPTSITIVSFDKKEYKIQKGLKPMNSQNVNVVINGKSEFQILPTNDSSRFIRYYSCFYGMGMGYHPEKYFEGPSLNDFFKDKMDFTDAEWIRHGLVCFVGQDGYRAIYSFSELFNRIDQTASILSITPNGEDGGFYRNFHPSDFYADRSVKSLTEIFVFKE